MYGGGGGQGSTLEAAGDKLWEQRRGGEVRGEGGGGGSRDVTDVTDVTGAGVAQGLCGGGSIREAARLMQGFAMHTAL